MRWLATLAIVVAGCSALSACGVVLGGSLNDERARSVAAALAQHSVHFRLEYSSVAGVETKTSGVAEAHAGKERLRRGAENAWIRFVGGTVYLNGNRAALTKILRLAPSRAKEYAGRWISIPRRGGEHRLYRTLAADLTLASLIRSAATLRWPLDHSQPKITRGHRRVMLVDAWRRESSAGLIVDEYGKRLPWGFFVDWRYGIPQAHLDGHLFQWNRPVILAVPAHAVPISTVRGG